MDLYGANIHTLNLKVVFIFDWFETIVNNEHLGFSFSLQKESIS